MKNVLFAAAFLSFNLYAAGDENLCRPITPNDIVHMFGRENVTYREYHDLVTSRTVEVKRGENLKDIIAKNSFPTNHIQHNVKLVKLANGLRSDIIKKNAVIYLPYCIPKDYAPVKEPASVTEFVIEPVITKQLKKEETSPLESKFVKSMGVLYGNVDIARGSNNLTADILKVSGRGSYQLSNGYSLTGSLALAHFRNVQHSSSNQKMNSRSAYPELGIEARKKIGIYSVGLAFDTLYYFIASDSAQTVQIEPSMISRVSIKPSVSLTDKVSAIGGAGLLKSFDDKSINGFDFTLGLNYSLGKMNEWNVTGLYNMNTMDTSESSQDDKSKTWILALGRVF